MTRRDLATVLPMAAAILLVGYAFIVGALSIGR